MIPAPPSDRQSGLGNRLEQAQPDARGGERSREPARPDLVQHRDPRQVERILQRFPRGHLALEIVAHAI